MVAYNLAITLAKVKSLVTTPTIQFMDNNNSNLNAINRNRNRRNRIRVDIAFLWNIVSWLCRMFGGGVRQ